MRYRGGQGREALPLGGIYSRRMEDYLRYHGRAIFIEDALNRLLAGQSFEAALELVANRLGRKEVSRLNLVKAELLHRLGRDVEAREECQRILGAYDADPDVWALLGWLEIVAGRSHLSRSLFERALALEPAHAVSLVNTAWLRHASSSTAMESGMPRSARACIATSLPPRHLELSKTCVRTWLRAGFEVISVNPAEEIRDLERGFPEVRFVPSRRDGREFFGKPLPYIEDMLAALRDSGAEIVGIVNADIALCHEGDFRAFVLEHARGGLLFGPRVDIAAMDAQVASLYRRGFDYYFFDAECLPDLAGSGFCMGAPWWDIYIPHACLMDGMPVRMNLSPVAYHLDHDMHWSVLDFYRMGLRFAQLLGGMLDVRDLAAVAQGCTVSSLNSFIMSQTRMACETLFRKSEIVYFDDPLFAAVTAPVDVTRHQDYMRTGLSFGGRPSPYGQAVAGDSL